MRTGKRIQHPGVNGIGFAHETKIDDFFDIRVGLALVLKPPGLDQVPVFSGNADGGSAGVVDGGDDLLVDRSGQHHFDNLDRPLVGHPQTVDEFAFDLHLLQHRADLRSPAMDDDRIDANLFQ